MAKGKGWFGQRKRHSIASKKGWRGRSKVKMPKRKKPLYVKQKQYKVDLNKRIEKEFSIKPIPKPLQDRKYKTVKGGMQITRRNGTKYITKDKDRIESILWHDGKSTTDIYEGIEGYVRD